MYLTNKKADSFSINCWWFFIFLCLFFLPVFGQSQSLSQAKKLFKSQEYEKALAIYANHKKTEKNPEYLLQRAICFYHTQEIDLCLLDLKKHEVFNTGDVEAWKYVGLCLG
ncbi:MAG: hypothetical protein WAT79_01070, partial [Saprospiraceae bacterium]